MKAILIFMLACALGACTNIPKPPGCDETNKRPLNVQPAPKGGAQ